MTDDEGRPGRALFDMIGRDKTSPAFLRVAEAADKAAAAASQFDESMRRIREQAAGGWPHRKHSRKPKRRG